MFTPTSTVILSKPHHQPLSLFLLRVSSIALHSYSNSYSYTLPDEILVDELLSSSCFRFWRTGGDKYCVLPEEDEDFQV